LIEESKARSAMLKEKLRFVLKSLTDKDAQFTLMAYNGLKQRAMMLNGVGMGDSDMKKIQLIKRLTNQGHNLQVMACNGIQEFLKSERAREEAERLEHERQQKEKDRILRRIMDANLRMAGSGFRQALQWTVADREAEIALMKKQRGIMRRIVDSNVRLMSAGYNKLMEESKARSAMLKEKLRFVLKSLTDKDAGFTLMAYNGLKQRAMMLNGVGMGDSDMKKIQLIKRLTNQGYNLQVMAANGLQEFLKSERAREEAERVEHERQQKEKSRILRRIMDANLRMAGSGFRQALQFAVADREAEIA
jgi:Pyruvate/2-oxoacid:ferredoxin oxidoreductase gamma subunit